MKFRNFRYTSLVLSLISIILIIYDFGFNQNPEVLSLVNFSYALLLSGIILAMPVKYFMNFERFHKPKVWIVDFILWILYINVLFRLQFFKLSETDLILWMHPKVILLFVFSLSLIREISDIKINWQYKRTNPATILVLSFFGLILTGNVLLMLPKATYSGISFIDAFFTSTSAVCVTGLTVVDTGTHFTAIGQTIILLLIQLGGLGIMTFTSYFAFFFTGVTSYQSLVMLGTLTSENRISEVIGTIRKIIIFTLIVEASGAALIFLNLNNNVSEVGTNPVFFSVFHSISAFCNAGFSTLSNNLYDTGFRYNYALHLIIALLFVTGGLGFPVILNLYSWLKYAIIKLISGRKRDTLYKAHIITLNTKLVLAVTLILLTTGTILFFIIESGNTLAEHHGAGRLISAFFSAATPRTAGFNTIDMAKISMPAMMLIIFLMWVGASPASTGGGIKTSTLALAVLNIISLAKGKNNLEINKRNISEKSIRRSFAFIFLSIFFIFLIVLVLICIEPQKNAGDLIFEVFSAFSTVGLSRGITSDLSYFGKFLIITTMFVGRIGALTFISSLVKKVSEKHLSYPAESILIN